MDLWIVGIHKGELESGDIAWEFAGVYSSREAAERACIEWEYFVGPAVLDRALPTETISWADSYYPQADKARELLTEVATGIADRFAPCGPIQVEVEPVVRHPGQYRLTFTVTIDDSDPDITKGEAIDV